LQDNKHREGDSGYDGVYAASGFKFEKDFFQQKRALYDFQDLL
jgi:hypothetical protein